jgi:hypothetical protein
MHIGDKKIEPADYPDVTSLGINFVKQRRAARNRSRHWPATGWTVRIDAAWKPNYADDSRNSRNR